jgi:hypothetical protein
MNTNRKTAVIVGVLFIIGTAAGVLSVVVTGPVLGDPGYLDTISADANPIIIGALLVLTMGLALAMVPVVIWPVLKEYNQVLALGYVVFRGGLETVTYIIVAVSWLLLIPLSEQYATAGAPADPYLQAMGRTLVEAAEISGTMTAIVFPLGAIMLYVVFYRSKLIPRWLTIWGLIGVALHLVFTGLAGMFTLTGSLPTIFMALNIPILVQEMVMAVWLIVKGFNSQIVDFARAASQRVYT